MRIIALNDLHYGSSGMKSRKIHESFSDLLAQKISKYNVDAVLIAGDIGSSRQSDLEKFFKLYCSKIKVPILLVFGNHDYWDEKPPYPARAPRTFHQLRELHDDMSKKYGFYYLENSPVTIKGVKFNGYDGWYKSINPGTNDIFSSRAVYMRSAIDCTPTHLFLNHRAHKECERVISQADSALVNVCVSHFDATDTGLMHRVNSEGYDPHRGDHNHLKALGDYFDFIFYGHTHREINERSGKARVLCAGGGYDHPFGIVVEIPESRGACDSGRDPVIERFSSIARPA